jgi:Na+-transporting methylmalonyl-CoA/oxaloacetate decarboxylase gamma subunit
MKHHRVVMILSVLATLALVIYLLGAVLNRGDSNGRRLRTQNERIASQNDRIDHQTARIDQLTAAQRESADRLAGALRDVQAAEEAARAAGQVPKQTLDQAIVEAQKQGVDPVVVREAVREVRSTPGPPGPTGPTGKPGAVVMVPPSSTTTVPPPSPSSSTTTTTRSCLVDVLRVVRVGC